ncbi:MAG: ankyrin [Proteobacteria bacterium]|nr:ankyrin [Pseudomonadota bacterium]MBU1584526.1 ankyrin [Pseudomonadota bacterium]MBU2451719.1 ankyrin [Pseudomonadota bacterium]MBU2631540.1 ankyrin [Pseudomonadota bacterium]
MESKIICPHCNGKKTIEGNCECNMEWRGSDGDEGWEDCKCEPDQKCPSCNGTGFIQSY